MFKKFTNGCVRVVNRWLPDAFLFAVILSIIVYVGAMLATGMGPLKVLSAWGSNDGFWGLLAFSMQMALVLVLGSAMASAKPCKKALRAVAGMCHNNMQAIVVTTFVSTVCCWLNWGFGLVIGALLAKEVVVVSLEGLLSGTALTSLFSAGTAYALLVFCLLYTPCMAAMSTIRRELGTRWMLFVMGFQCVVAWVVAFIINLIL